jgi:lambda family phage portal protein
MKLSVWDRFTASLAPRWTMNRLRARATMDMLARHYEAAQPGRRTSGWSRSVGDANLALQAALVELRIHARDLVRNNSWAKRGQRVIANHTVGWGVVPKAVTDNAALATRTMELWSAWASTTECETEGRHTFYGLQHLAMKTIAESGEVLFRRRWRRASDGLTLPFQLQVLEPDFLDHSRVALSSQSGGPIIQGVEFDKLGRRTAYWLFEQHPGSGRNSSPSKRVSASEILHVFYPERPGQSRGVSWFAAAILNLKDLDEYEDAELMKQKIAACFAAFVTDVDGAGSPLGEPDAADNTLETFEPGMIARLPPGKNVTIANPPAVTSDSFTTRNLRRIAAGLGVTYEDLTGDYSQVNFSSARMARLSHWAHVHDWQWNMLIPLLCHGVWNWAMEAALVAGEISEAPGSDWTTPPMPMIEPDKEGLAYQRLVRNGVMTPSSVVREQGGDPDTHFAEYAADMKRLDALGIKLDVDVRAVSQAGQAQQAPVSEATKAAERLAVAIANRHLGGDRE